MDDADGTAGLLSLQFAGLTRGLLAAGSVAEVLRRVVDAALRVVPAADVVSVTLRDPDGGFHTPVATDPVADQLDELQYEFGEGPCVEAAKPEGPAYALSDHLAAEPRWPRFGAAAAEHGFGSVFAVALLPDDRPATLTGALNVYSYGGGLTAADLDAALLLATHASLALAATRAVDFADLKVAQLSRAIETRDIIGQAKGILMQRRGIDADAAYAVLRDTSQRLNIKLFEIAETLATRREELG
ncbi:ANTAR domain-containing protein [Actinokineospora bangkokensis]|uniref:ANTAR domain-containing protein n=1 Tax=Actinokineospora bangkokensis TaxID=1193682 RepID=UPI001E5109CB|nr:ANTAR domain-containing protein [Actinokineospora bangkokensis]